MVYSEYQLVCTTCSEKLCDKNGHFGGFVRHISFYLFIFLTPSQFQYLVSKYLSLLIIVFQYAYLSTLLVCANLIDIFIVIMGQKFNGTVYFHTIIHRRININKTRTAEATTSEGRSVQSLDCVFTKSFDSITVFHFISDYLLFYLFWAPILISTIQLCTEVATISQQISINSSQGMCD